MIARLQQANADVIRAAARARREMASGGKLKELNAKIEELEVKRSAYLMTTRSFLDHELST